jgi:hypothetical protein
MEWLAGIVFGLGVLTWSMRQINARHSRRTLKVAPMQTVSPQAPAVSEARAEAEKPIPTGLDQTDDPLERHSIYTQLMEKAFQNRTSSASRDLLLEMGQQYQAEFDRLLPRLRKEMGTTPEILPLKWLAIAFEEDGRYEDALEICRRAQEWDISDGTKTGFAGRQHRIERKREKEAQKG